MTPKRISGEELRKQIKKGSESSRKSTDTTEISDSSHSGDDSIEEISSKEDFEVPDDISTYSPDCQKCDDTGILQRATAYQIPKFCDCSNGEDKQSEYKRELWKKQRIPRTYWNESLKSFQTDQVTDSIQKAYEFARSFLENLKVMLRKGKGIYFWGENGVGKSHLLVSIIKHAARTVPLIPRPLYVQAPKLVLSHKPSSESVFEEHVDPHRNFHETPLLFLDELDDINGTTFEFEVIQDLLKTRYNNQRSTLIASNVKPSQLEEEMEGSVSMNGLTSRFKSMLLVHGLDGEDKR